MMSKAHADRSVISVSEMARMVGLSRSRFYQLVGTAFPQPERDPETGRPYYGAEQQAICLDVRRRNCGIDGKPILFYSRRPAATGTPGRKHRQPKPSAPKSANCFVAILDGVRALGLASATERQIEGAMRELFPSGTTNVEPEEVIRAVFVALMRQNRADNVGR